MEFLDKYKKTALMWKNKARFEVGMCHIASLLNILNKAEIGFMDLQLPKTGGRCLFTDKSTGEQNLHCNLNLPSEMKQPPKQQYISAL